MYLVQLIEQAAQRFQSHPEDSSARYDLGILYITAIEHLFHELFNDPSSARIKSILELALLANSLLDDLNDPIVIEGIYRAAILSHLIGDHVLTIKLVDKAKARQAQLLAQHPLRDAGIRFLQTRSGTLSQMGHLVAEPDCFIKAQRLGLCPTFQGMLLAPNGATTNSAMLELWRRYICVITDPELCRRIAPHAKALEFNSYWYTLPNIGTLYGHSGFLAICSQWEERGGEPIVSLSEEMKSTARRQLREMGLPDDAWFAALHVRSRTVLNDSGQPKLTWDAQRNANIATYLDAIRAVTDRGGWVIRLGDSSMPSLPEMKNVIDLAQHPAHGDVVDLYVGSASRFFVGTASGPCSLAWTFGVPLLLTNASPLACFGMSRKDIYLPKLNRWTATHEFLTFREALSPERNYLFNCLIYHERGIEFVDNTSDEITSAVIEMMDRLDGTATDSRDDIELQARFKRIANPVEPFGMPCRIAKQFVRQHQHLLDPAPTSTHHTEATDAAALGI